VFIEDVTVYVVIGFGVMLAIALVCWLNFSLQRLPKSVGQYRRETLIVGTLACVIGVIGAYGVYVLWLKKPSTDLLMLNRAFRFPEQVLQAGDELDLEFALVGGEVHGQLLTMVLLKDASGREVTHQDRTLGHAGTKWESLAFRFRVTQSGKYKFDVFTPSFVEDVKLIKGPAGI
jgi:hypothetical protein